MPTIPAPLTCTSKRCIATIVGSAAETIAASAPLQRRAATRSSAIATDLDVTLESIHVYPVKSCAGSAPREAVLTETGLDLDRQWLVVDPAGVFVTQRELPRMALVRRR